MSNVYRLAHVPDITYDVVDLPPDVRDADWLHRILQGGAEAVTVPDDWPILAAPDQSMSKLVRFSHDPGMALSCEFDPADNDEIVLALNNALQIDLHRRTGPPCTIQFFISGDVICAYVVAPHMAPEPPERTPSSLHDLLECTSQLLAPSGSSTSLSSSPSAGNVATPAGQHASTTPRSGSAAALTSPGPGARPISPGPPRPKVASRHVSSAFLFRKRSPAYGGITLPDQVASVKIPKYMARFVPHRIRYVREREYADCTPSPVKMDIDDVRAPVPDEGEAGGGSSSEQSNDESEMIDESDPHDEFELAAALPALLVLLQQHVHDPFFCRIVLGYTAESVPRQGRFRQHLSQRFLRQRCLALASISLPDWRLEAEPVPVMSLGSDSAVHPNQLSSIERVTIEDCEVLTGFDGDIRTLSPSAIAFWDEACLEPFKSRADISYVVVPDMTASRSEQSSLYQPFFEALSVMYETCMLGRHSAIKCIDDFMSMPTLFHGGSARQYYEFVMDQIGSPALRAKLSSTETSIVVLYLVVDKDDGLLSSLPWFSSVVNRLRLAFGSPTWDSSSRRKNVIAQVVPRGVIHERYDLVEDGRCSTLRQMAFSVFSRCHFVPAIPADARGQQSDQLLSNGLGLTALEPAFVVHARSDIPYPGHVAGHDQQQRSLLAVHVAYTVVGEYVCGCATDMRGERLQTSVSRGATLARGLESFWTACIRPILDFLHSRTDQGAMTLVVCRNGTRMPADEQSLWASLLASRLGGVWTSLNERDLRGRDDAPRDETIIARDVAAEDAAPADTRFLVSAAFLTSCAGSPALQPVDDPSEACFVMHRHWPMDAACGPRAIVHGNIYDGRTGIALQMSLEAYVVHSPANHQVVTCVTPAFVFDAFRAVLEQTAALTLFEPGEPPLHISTTHRLARLLAVALPDAADARQQQSSPSDGRPA